MMTNSDFAEIKTKQSEVEEYDAIKELAKAICKKYILDVLQTPSSCFKEQCINKNGEKKKKCLNCREMIFQKDKVFILQRYTELLFSYAEMENVYELLLFIFNKYNSLEDFRKKKVDEELWKYIDFTKEQYVVELACKRKDKERKKIIYILLDENGNELIRGNNLIKIKKFLVKKIHRGVYPKKIAERLLDDYLFKTKSVDLPYRLKVEIIKK